MVKEAYEKLKKKHNLPDYGIVNNELEISSFESADFLLRKIRRKIIEKIDDVSMTISGILQPAAESIADMHECRFFDDDDKKKLVEAYKDMMIFKRQSTEAELLADDKKDAEFVNSFFKEWDGIKKSIIPFIEKAKKCWEKETEIEEKLDYMG